MSVSQCSEPYCAFITALSFSGYFSTLCTVYADTSRVVKHQHFGSNGVYYQQEFKVVLSCGQTELKAQISWVENVSAMFDASRVLNREADA